MNFAKDAQPFIQEYLSEGYAVITHPNASHLPPFALDFSVDFVATRGSEHVLVKVIADRAGFQTDQKISRQAEITNKQPGWRYDVIVLQDDIPHRDISRSADEPTIDQINQMLDEAEGALNVTTPRASFVLAWAGLEAVLRRAALHIGLENKGGTQLTVLVRELYSSGRISPEEFRILDETMKLRNAIVHGLAPPIIALFTVRSLIDLARKILAECEALLA